MPRQPKFLFLLLTLAKLALAASLPMTALAYAGYDDALFVRLGQRIAMGNWLGPYDFLVLAKGPGFPLFIAICYRLGVNLSLAEQLLYVLFCVVLVVALRPVIRSRAALLALYAIVLFNPESFPIGDMARVIREGIYPALSGLVLATAIGLALRRNEPLAKMKAWVIGLGISLAMFWITREEGLWIVPSLVLILAVPIISIIRQRPPQWMKRVATVTASVVISMALICGVETINFGRYHEFVLVELKDPAFLAAYGALARVTPTVPHARVPVSKEVREKIYSVSPAFRELQPYLEGDLGRGWQAAGASIYPTLKDEIVGGWFVWALRDAVNSAGHAHKALDAHRYYQQLADEVNAACDDGRLPAGPRRDTLTPPWRSGYAWPMCGNLWEAIKMLAGFQDIDATLPPSGGMGSELQLMRRIIGGAIVSPGGAATTDPMNAAVVVQLRGINLVIHVYRWIAPWWTILAAASFLFLLITRRAGILCAIGGSLLPSILLRLGLLALISLTSFPAINSGYLSPLHPWLLIFDLLISVEMIGWIRSLRRGPQPDRRAAAAGGQIQL